VNPPLQFGWKDEESDPAYGRRLRRRQDHVAHIIQAAKTLCGLPVNSTWILRRRLKHGVCSTCAKIKGIKPWKLGGPIPKALDRAEGLSVTRQ
jgi:hypothetical protein